MGFAIPRGRRHRAQRQPHRCRKRGKETLFYYNSAISITRKLYPNPRRADAVSHSGAMLSSRTSLRLTFLSLQVLAGVAVALVVVWMASFQGGFAWHENPKIQFNYHPVFLTVGLVVIAGRRNDGQTHAYYNSITYNCPCFRIIYHYAVAQRRHIEPWVRYPLWGHCPKTQNNN